MGFGARHAGRLRLTGRVAVVLAGVMIVRDLVDQRVGRGTALAVLVVLGIVGLLGGAYCVLVDRLESRAGAPPRPGTGRGGARRDG